MAMDLSQARSLFVIASSVANMINRNLPIRFGLVPLVESEETIRMYRILNYLIENYGRESTMAYLRTVNLRRSALIEV